ncbi:MAG: hypothetical protein GXY57_01810 [Erysipelotrichaceae bacterium]|jgi:hypothetical protein|nr:hypothetical protein [Bacilli bacterium]NLV28886.1 hypothetical protein [Erysipelotrichaceae bacterium]HPY79930.1 hypothetical protein [Bacilli bacterium]HQA56000.1 hypothetical protein [Bacilli bacterium]
MENIFKTVGKGLLYLLVLPVFLLVITGYALVGAFCFIYLFFKSIILFFSGRSLKIELPEDVKAKKIIQKIIASSQDPLLNPDGVQPAADDKPAEDETNDTTEPSIEEVAFGPDEDIAESVPPIVDATIVDPEPEQDVFIPEPEPEIEPVQQQKNEAKFSEEQDAPEVYTPKKTKYQEVDSDIDDEDRGGGVDISFKGF